MSELEWSRLKKSLRLNVLFFIVFAIYSVNVSSLTKAPDVERLVTRSGVILIGTVVGAQSYSRDVVSEDKYGELIYEEVLTDFTISVTEVLKGTLNSETFKVTSIGGKANGRWKWATMSFQLTVGQEVLIFADYDQENDIWWGHQHSLGVYGISNDGVEEYLTSQTDEPVYFNGEILSREQFMQENKQQLTVSNIRELLLLQGE